MQLTVTAAAAGTLLLDAAMIAAFGISAPSTVLAEAVQRHVSAGPRQHEPDPQTTASPRASVDGHTRRRCHNEGAFVPTRVSIAEIAPDAEVLALNRDPADPPGAPPMTEAGKRKFAWDAAGAKPGSSRGNVNMNAHTWPDGTALGNALLRELSTGDVIVAHGAHGERQCYEVVRRRELAISHVPQHVLERFYDVAGPPELTMIVCSGTRRGPGEWTHRTLWYGTPVGSTAGSRSSWNSGSSHPAMSWLLKDASL